MATERSEGAVYPLDTTKDKSNTPELGPGAASSSTCPRAGAIILEDAHGVTTEVTTTCNTWGCLGCRDRNLARFRAILVKGVSTLGRCSFITITYKQGSERLKDAGCVSRDWKAFWRKARRDTRLQKMEHLRVMELTKRGTPHFHLIVGSIPTSMRIKCWRGSSFNVTDYKDRLASCGCLSHVMARIWQEVTKGESWIVYAIPVSGGSGAASYLAKYMQKGSEEGNETSRLGMHRRWSTSKGWPAERRMRLSNAGYWRRAMWTPGEAPRDLEGEWPELEKKGTPAQKKEATKQAIRRYLNVAKGVMHD